MAKAERGFHGMDPVRQRAIASLGGLATKMRRRPAVTDEVK